MKKVIVDNCDADVAVEYTIQKHPEKGCKNIMILFNSNDEWDGVKEKELLFEKFAFLSCAIIDGENNALEGTIINANFYKIEAERLIPYNISAGFVKHKGEFKRYTADRYGFATFYDI